MLLTGKLPRLRLHGVVDVGVRGLEWRFEMRERNKVKQCKTRVTHKGTLNLNGYRGIPGPGRPKMTPEQRLLWKAEQDAYSIYLEKLEKLISQVLEVYETAVSHDLGTPQDIAVAVKVCELIENRLFGKPSQRLELLKIDEPVTHLVDLTPYKRCNKAVTNNDPEEKD